MNKHVKCGLKILGSPLVVSYLVLVAIGALPVMFVSVLGFLTCADDAEQWVEKYYDFGLFPLFWYREL